MTPRVDVEELVTSADIGRRLGITRQRAHQLSAEEGFPAPLGRVGNYVVFRWRDVEAWARKAGRIEAAPAGGPTRSRP